MKLLYKPFAIIAGIVAARLGRKAFKQLWGKFDEQDPPDPATEEAAAGKIIAAAALEAATMAAVAAAVDRAGARAFHHLFGIWPGKKQEDKTEQIEAASAG